MIRSSALWDIGDTPPGFTDLYQIKTVTFFDSYKTDKNETDEES